MNTHTCKWILSTAVQFKWSWSPDGQVFLKSWKVGQFWPEPSLIPWFKNHTCETRSRWEILLVDSAEAMVHYQVISLGHSEVTSLIKVTAKRSHKIQLLSLKVHHSTFLCQTLTWCKHQTNSHVYCISLFNPLTTLQGGSYNNPHLKSESQSCKVQSSLSKFTARKRWRQHYR